MPAMGAIPDDSLFNFGFSLNLDAVPTLVNKRAGAIASLSPIMQEVRAFANEGGIVVGIGMELVPEAIENAKADGQANAQNPTEIPHRLRPS